MKANDPYHTPVAYKNEEFLDSDDARPLRILAEYLEPQRRFKLQNIQDTVVFFGSARIHSREAAQHALDDLMKVHGVGTTTDVEEIVARGRRAVEWSRYYEEARQLARMLTEWSLTITGSLGGGTEALVAAVTLDDGTAAVLKAPIPREGGAERGRQHGGDQCDERGQRSEGYQRPAERRVR